MNKLLKLFLILLLLFPFITYSQNNHDKRSDNNARKKSNADNTNDKVIKTDHQDNLKNISSIPGVVKAPDYKIISSNRKYIEIEFYPSFHSRQVIRYKNQSFDFITFDNAAMKNAYSIGQPILQCRIFPIFVPSEQNNFISVIDYDESDVKGINFAPVPDIRFKDPHNRNFENVEFDYKKDPDFYSHNNFFPQNIAELSSPQPVRDNVIANIILNPYCYNPVTGTLKQYTRIRVRITFNKEPISVSRPRTLAEIELLKNAALNSDIGINWQNPKLHLNYKNVQPFNSVMNSGDWYRIEIRDNGMGGSDGIYKITKDFLQNAGIDLTNVDPRTIKMYGNGGTMLDTSLISPRPQDLTEIAIYIYGEDDGHFDSGDYILFYGSSVNNWVYDTSSSRFYHEINIYSGSNYYWLCLNTQGFGKRMQVIQSENDPNALHRDSFTERLFFEPEITNPLNEGNVWLSDSRTNGGYFTWNNTLVGLLNGSNIFYRIKPASRVMDGFENHMYLSEDNSTVSPLYFQMYTVHPGYDNWIWTGTDSFTINTLQKTNGNQSSFKAAFYTSDPAGEGYIDWMEILYQRSLNSVAGDFIRIIDTSSQLRKPVPIEYNVSPFSSNSIKVFDAADLSNLKIINSLPSASGTVRFQKTPRTLIYKYFVVGDNGYKTPTSISSKFPNQNLHGITDGADFIIISYPDFIPAANRLKTKREGVGPNDPGYLKTMVVDVQKIYNEFSGGLMDPVAVRDFLKYAFFNWSRKPSYVCFFGSGSVDYRNIEQLNSNFVPVFEFSDPNIHQVHNYCTDDFFVHLTGESVSPLIPDMAYGRIPARYINEANGYIDKLDCYENGSYNENWKNKIILTADDGYTYTGSDGNIYVIQSEDLAAIIPQSFELIKIYLIEYPPVLTSAGRRKPDANSDLIKYWNEGADMINWIGHGSPDLWAHEYVFEKDVIISQLNNVCKYPFVTVESCDFGKYDDPTDFSGSEELMITANKGSIGTLAATRPTFSTLNESFTNTFYNQLFALRDTLLLQYRFGLADFQTKLQLYDENSLKFGLLCDPTLRNQYPRFYSRIDSMVGLSYDTMRALSKIKIYGSVIHPDSSLWSGYHGKIYMKIYDTEKHIQITDEFGNIFNFTLPGGIIFSGNQSVNNGLFTLEFIVPKDISYQNQNGKLINYFFNTSFDGASFNKNFIIGEIDPDAPIDTTGPKITVYLNNPNFRSGDVVNENFTLMADFFDESGINTTGTIGHKIEATINNDIRNKYDLTTYYNSDTSYQYGHLSYVFTGFSPGKYNLKLKAWDTYDNPSEASIDFTVSLSSSLQVMNVYNYPNPFKDKTVFTFQHNYPDAVNVKINIYTVSGRLIKVITQNNIPDKFVVIDWNGADQDGDKISNGVYIYKLTVAPTNGTNSVISTGKLAVLK